MYRMYTSEMLRAIAGRFGVKTTVKYSDLIKKKQGVSEQRSSFEIIDGIKAKLAKVRG